MSAQLISGLLAWFLVIETGRFMLEPPYVEPPEIIARFDMSGGSPDGGKEACEQAREGFIAQGFKAECHELI